MGSHIRNHGKNQAKKKNPQNSETSGTPTRNITHRKDEKKIRLERPTTNFGSFKPNKSSREEIAEINGELLNRANRFGGGYQPFEERVEENTPQDETEKNDPESEGESQIVRGDNFPIVDLKTYNTEAKEAQFIQRNQVLDKITGDKKTTEETIKKAEFNFMLDLKTLIAKSATDGELNRVRDAMRRGEKNMAPEQY